MSRIEEFLKRGIIIGMAVLTLGGVFAPILTPPMTAYAATSSTTASKYKVSDFSYKGNTTGHTTNIVTKEADWEYSAPDYIITDLTMPLNYVNPWYAKDSKDADKAVKSYYYLGTIVYNDTITGDNQYAPSSLSEQSQKDYDTLYKLFKNTVVAYTDVGYAKTTATKYAKAEIVEKGCKLNMKDLPLIYQIITGEKFDYKAWKDEGITGAKNYSSYKMPALDSTSNIKQGKKSNYATKVSVSSSNKGVATTYSAIVDGEARVYVKGAAKGTATLTIKTTLNDGQTVTYKTKVTITAAGTPIKYTTSVNPLSYAGYCIEKDTANWLGYLSKFGDYYSTSDFIGDSTIYNQTGKVDVLSTDPHPSIEKASTYSGSEDYYKFIKADTSDFMYNFLDGHGIFAMAVSGKYTQYEVYSAAMQAILEQDDYNIDNNLRPEKGQAAHHYSLESYLNGRRSVCDDEAAIAAGVAKLLGIPYYARSISNDIKCMVVMGGKVYEANAGNVKVYDRPNEVVRVLSSYSSLNNVALKDLASGKYKFNVKTDNNNAPDGAFYKVTDTYEAGRFQYGLNATSIKVDTSYGILKSGLSDVRMLTFRSGLSPQWINNINNTITFRYNVPYMEKTFFGSLKVKSTTQLNLVNSDWTDWTIKTSSSKIAAVTTTGKITMTGSGTATITLTHKTIKGLSIKVMVSTSSISASTAKSKTGTYYTGNDAVYDSSNQIIHGNYMRMSK